MDSQNEEEYNFRHDPSPHVKVFIKIDETTYGGGDIGKSPSTSWYHEYDGGQAWYTAMGHTRETYCEPLFLNPVWGGILWVAGKITNNTGYGRKEIRIILWQSL